MRGNILQTPKKRADEAGEMSEKNLKQKVLDKLAKEIIDFIDTWEEFKEQPFLSSNDTSGNEAFFIKKVERAVDIAIAEVKKEIGAFEKNCESLTHCATDRNYLAAQITACRIIKERLSIATKKKAREAKK